ncbi:uncharacterized protein Z520_03064 [Fonsecaea multimorphosa CBS 102226]|uniref:BZIP domain-containing protein n=1 Tax=Fonsecaea multimorphosa CBS 102226 TaxID=1442371 RepID=A0A0D2IWZ4_9EURO|nr:uncharacterized protein Z520_03064 [Fonsecaea multimorphosa CBS 102226]KIY01512.1 hypothetical protein Z520_03064 [Fonsecaea multimorphosa CBS 102226]OAL28272.1 hypothetical protein AYO22_02978 [Fonsecaea multimorphosa]
MTMSSKRRQDTSQYSATQYPSVAPRVESRIPTSSDSENPPGEIQMQIGETAEMRERRRVQNRLAQQAFRARQKIRVQALESEWTQLRQLHEALNQACSQQAKEIKQLQSRVEELLQDIELIKNSQENEGNSWSSSCPTTPEQQLPMTSAITVAEAELRNFFIEGRISDFPEFPESFRSRYSA